MISVISRLAASPPQCLRRSAIVWGLPIGIGQLTAWLKVASINPAPAYTDYSIRILMWAVMPVNKARAYRRLSDNYAGALYQHSYAQAQDR
ncbi:hypothetical protein [Mycobacterium uberis]|uniref:hypothetical protein n=1 Tax=Mycobacterium uberis TaxID=2162698 RepID=UPI000E308CAC|nr:hypothetical protein [Mycobacterium uberis]